MIGSAWELLAFLRVFTVTVAIVVIGVGFFAVSEKLPWVSWIAVLMVVAVAVRNSRRRRGSTSHAGHERPAWLDEARWYYSEIGGESDDPVRIFDASGLDEVTSESPGTLCLRLEPRFSWSPRVRVLDAGGREQGIICSEGLVPGVRYAMCRNGEIVWILTVRSIVRKHHALEMADGDSWTFDTPYFWWHHYLVGTASGAPRLFGGFDLPTKRVWTLYFEPGRDTFDLLAAVAFLHRQYWHT